MRDEAAESVEIPGGPAWPPSAEADAGGLPRVGVVLAAGRSERLHEVTGGGSKALVRLGGLTLVERAVLSLLGAGVERVVVVVGYHGGPVAAVVSRIARGRVRTVEAEDWELGNGASLAAAEAALVGEQTFALLTADHVFSEGAVDRLLHAGGPAVLVDAEPGAAVWEEGTRVRVLDDRALSFGKGLEEPAVDCGAFVLPAAIFASQRRAAREQDQTLAGAVSRLAAIHPIRAVRMPSRGWWQDIDTPEDLRAARSRLRRSLTKTADGPVSRYLNRPVSSRISMAIAPLRLSPDLVSVLAFLLAGLAGWFLQAGQGVAGGLLVHATSVLDGVDGEVARLQLRASPRGAMLDGVLDRLGDLVVLAGLGLWALASGGTAASTALLLAVVATAGAMLSMASKDRIAALGLPEAPERALSFLLGGRDGRLLLIAVAGLVGAPEAGLAAVAVTAFVALALRVAHVRRVTAHVGHHP